MRERGLTKVKMKAIRYNRDRYDQVKQFLAVYIVYSETRL